MTAINITAINERRASSVNFDRFAGPARAWQRHYSHWLVAADLTAVVAAVGLAQWLRFGTWSGTTYLEVSVIIGAVWMAVLSINHSRSQRIIGSGAEEYRRVWLGTASVFGGIAVVSMLFKLEIARGYLMIALPTGLTLLIFLRWIARGVVIRARGRHGHCAIRVLAVGSALAVRDLTTALAREPWSGYKVVGACITGSADPTQIEVDGVGPVPTYGNESSVVGAVTATNSDVVAITATEHLDGHRIRNLSWDLEKLNIDLLVAPGVVDVAGPRLHMRPVAGLPLIHVEKPQYHGAKKFQKRLFDVTFSSLVLLCGLPLLVAIAVVIKMTSKGPVIYRQERIGLDGKAFEMIKFRTMVDGADEMLNELAALNESLGGVLFKIREDPRVTSVGRIMRKYSLDEIPQFINVLKREMSVVGPRPPLAGEAKTYDDHAKRRLLVRPGITGLWQVSGRSNLSWEDSVRLDLYYIENWSMMADLLIAVKTAKAVFSHNGAY
jgi:exopolysaccharide biosynthesis polyprenyl glycosylphosphotransferase